MYCTVSEYSVVSTFKVNKVEVGYNLVDRSHSGNKCGHVVYSTVKWDSSLQLARQAMSYNITFKCFRVTVVAVDKQ
jgi:hypothetical protein